MSEEDLFKYALKRVSVEAFDALLTCGVRNLAGLLRLTSEDMRSAGLSHNIISELMDITFQLKKYATEPGAENYKLFEDDTPSLTLKEESEEPLCGADSSSQNFSLSTPIPNNLLERLPTRAKNVLNQENILTIERLLEFQEEDLYCIRGIGRKTVHDIKQLQVKVTKSQMTIIHASANETLKVESECEDRPCPFRRVRCLSRNAEHSISDPADWSLLSRTLPDLYWITLPGSDTSDDEDDMTIADLDISTDDLSKLCEIALFPEDEADILFSVSLGYLLQVNISDKTFSIMFDYLGRLSGNISLSELFVATAKVADTPVFDDLKTDLIAGFRIPENLLQNLYEVLGNDKSLVSWGDVKKISERNIIKQLGFTLHGLKTIKSLWQLKEHAQTLITKISAGLPASAYNSFGDLVNAFVRSIIKKEYYYPVLMGRLGFLDERKWTLEELGQRLNLTRERIRQMEKKLAPVLEKSTVIDRLSLLWYAVNESLNLGGGVCCVSEIAHSLKNLWQWTSLPADEALASLISLSPTYEIIWDNPLRVIMPNHACVNCQMIREFLVKAVEGRGNGILDISEAVKNMSDFCQSQPCKQLSDANQFSNGFLRFLDDVIEEVIADEECLYTQYAWALKYGKRRQVMLVETILRNAGRSMHFTEVHAELNKARPEHGQFSEHNVYAYIERSSDLLLWDRGTYIHRDHVCVPNELIATIENEIICRLDRNIPYLSVSGIFEQFKIDLTKNEVPSESALYSCLRESSHQKLICPDYPYILKNIIGALRQPAHIVLEDFVLNQDGIVTYEEIKKYAVDDLCLSEVNFVANYFPNIPNLLRVNRGEYIHSNQLSIDEDKLKSIIDHLEKLLITSSHISAIRLYNDKKITCRLLGITTPELLFSLVQYYYSDMFELSRYPKISLRDLENKGRTRGVASEVLYYIREKNTPCSFTELYKHFVEDLGYKQMSIYNVHFNKQIKRYSESVIIHLGSLEWDDKKQTVLETLATNQLVDRESSGKPFGLVSHLYEYQHDQLPDLPDQIPWTPTLIGELLAHCDKFCIIGTQRDVFVSIPNKYNIESLDDLLYIILDATYDGAANIDQFISDMCVAGILKKSLTPMMLGSESRVVIDGKVVRLARLN